MSFVNMSRGLVIDLSLGAAVGITNPVAVGHRTCTSLVCGHPFAALSSPDPGRLGVTALVRGCFTHFPIFTSDD